MLLILRFSSNMLWWIGCLWSCRRRWSSHKKQSALIWECWRWCMNHTCCICYSLHMLLLAGCPSNLAGQHIDAWLVKHCVYIIACYTVSCCRMQQFLDDQKEFPTDLLKVVGSTHDRTCWPTDVSLVYGTLLSAVQTDLYLLRTKRHCYHLINCFTLSQAQCFLQNMTLIVCSIHADKF